MQSVRRPVQAIYVHPQYNPLDMENNLAVLRVYYEAQISVE